MRYKNKKINNCLLCKSKNLREIFSLGNLYVSNFVKKRDIKRGIRSPLELLYCKECSLIQLSHIAPQEIMYRRFYWYRSGVTQTMQLGLKDIFKESKELAPLILMLFSRFPEHSNNDKSDKPLASKLVSWFIEQYKRLKTVF